MHINERILSARRAMAHPHKSNNVDAGSGKRYRFAPLNSVLDGIISVCKEHGLAVTQSAVTRVDGWDRIEKQDRHGNPRVEWVARGVVDVTTTIRAVDGAEVVMGPLACPWFGGSQDVGIATTYARRYGLLTAFGLYGDDDNDGLTPDQMTEATIQRAQRQEQTRRPKADACTAALRAAGCQTAADAEAVALYLTRSKMPTEPEDRDALAASVERWTAENGSGLVQAAREWAQREQR